MLKLRILTAFLLIPCVIGGIFYLSQPYFMLITALIMLIAAWEWSRLSGYISIKERFFYLVVQSLVLLLAVPFLSTSWIFVFGLILWFFLIIYLIWVRSKRLLPPIPTRLRAGLGWLILTLSWVALQRLYLTPSYLVFMLLIVWLADTAAYMSGRLLGRHLLAPTLSPKKTWEGLIIGLLFTFFFALFIPSFLKEIRLSLWKIEVLVFLTSVAAVAGDLFESQLKRLQGLKDSGQLLPGHGGILDRIDSLLAAAPVFAGSLLFLGFPL